MIAKICLGLLSDFFSGWFTTVLGVPGVIFNAQPAYMKLSFTGLTRVQP